MATDIFYSGVEVGQHYRTLLRMGASRVLQSYYYVMKHKKDYLRERKAANPEMDWMLDSGGFSLQTLHPELLETDNAKRVQFVEEFLKKYVEYIHDNKDCLYSAVELDVENIVGYGQVREWHKQYFEPLEKEGLKIIYLWHPERGLGEWEAMCRRHKRVGVNALVFDTMEMDMQAVMAPAKKYLTRVHGFALTGQKVIDGMGLDTADSVTWKVGERFALLLLFIDGRLFRKPLEKANEYEQYIRECGVDYDALVKGGKEKRGDYKARTDLALNSFLRMERFYAEKDEIDYYEYRLPDPENVFDFDENAMKLWAEKLKHLETRILLTNEDGLDLNWLVYISCLQNGRIDFLHENFESQRIVDDFLALFGARSPLSITNESQFEEIRKMMCSMSLPPNSFEAQRRVSPADFLPKSPVLKRETRLSPTVRQRHA